MGNQLEYEMYCPCCKKKKIISSFIVDYRVKDNFLAYCKSCTDKLVDKIQNEFGMAEGVWTACMVNNVPMKKQIWKQAYDTILKNNSKSPFAIYYRTLKENNIFYEGVWESDCWLGNFHYISDTEQEENFFTKDEIKELEKDWGSFITKDELGNNVTDYKAYEFLVTRYNNYTQNIFGLTDAMAMQFRNLCKAEWQKIKADESGDISEIDKAQKLIDRLLSQLKLDNFATEKSDTDRFIDRLVWRIEETEPAELEDRQKYSDIAGYEEMYNSIMRSMKNLIAGTREYPDVTNEDV